MKIEKEFIKHPLVQNEYLYVTQIKASRQRFNCAKT